MTDKPNCGNCTANKKDCQETCLSHPGAREWLMKDVLQKLENKKTMLEGMEPDYGSENYIEAITIGKVITLLRDGVQP